MGQEAVQIESRREEKAALENVTCGVTVSEQQCENSDHLHRPGSYLHRPGVLSLPHRRGPPSRVNTDYLPGTSRGEHCTPSLTLL